MKQTVFPKEIIRFSQENHRKVKQYDITDCGAACLASVAAYLKLNMPISKIRQWTGTDIKAQTHGANYSCKENGIFG